MKLISHRGNINGRNPERENTPEYIEEALINFDVEIDLMYKDNSIWLGHCSPEIKIDTDWLLKNSSKLWIHCKDLESLDFLSRLNDEILESKNYTTLNYFGHSNDPFVLTSKNILFCLPSNNLTSKCVLVMPEYFGFEPCSFNIYGILTDYPINYKKYKK